jgi:hypothetical protein
MSNAVILSSNVAPVVPFADSEVSFDYLTVGINDLRAVPRANANKKSKRQEMNFEVAGEEMVATERMVGSLLARFGFSNSIFDYFSHEEVFNRISTVKSNDRIRLCIERDHKTRAGKLLGVSNPAKPLVSYEELMGLLGRYNAENVTYANGIVESTHTPRVGSSVFEVGGDKIANRFMMQIPIDGYGSPSLYLSLLRQVCSNGMIGYSKAFKSTLALGKGGDDVAPMLTRALDGFGNDEGYAALRSRVEESANSWASVNEAHSLYETLTKQYANKAIEDNNGQTPTSATKILGYLNAPKDGSAIHGHEGIGSQLLTAFHRMTGDISSLYGIANIDSLSVKRKQTLPVKCTVYDLVNFATEVSTHYANASGARAIQAWVGSLVSAEYDMEGTRDKLTDFADFHIKSRLESGLTGSARQMAV